MDPETQRAQLEREKQIRETYRMIQTAQRMGAGGDDYSDVVPLPGPNEIVIAMRNMAKSAGGPRFPEVDYSM